MKKTRISLIFTACFFFLATSAMAGAPGTLAEFEHRGPLTISTGLSASDAAVEFEISFGRTVNAVGFGTTTDEALERALSLLREDYFVLSYTVIDSLCTPVELEPWEPHGQTVMICSVSIRARVIRKAILMK